MSAEPKPAAELSTVESNGVGLRVRFFWQGDRYIHRIESVKGHSARVLLESLEGDHESEWPASPALQHVNVSWIRSDHEQGHVAMLVGASGKSHWSMCVAVRDRECEARDGGRGDTELFFDIACRTPHSAGWLGSSYRALAGPAAFSERLNCAFVPADGPGCVVVPEGAELEMDTTGAWPPILRCAAMGTKSPESPTTVRWRYAVRLSTGGPVKVGRRR